MFRTAAPSKVKYLLEIGCGCGNFILPLLDNSSTTGDACQSDNKVIPDNLFIFCCDISESAIDLLKSNRLYQSLSPQRLKAFAANVITDDARILAQLDGNLVDFVSLVFVLSALEPDKMGLAIDNVYKFMKPSGMVLFRDYAIYDKAMLRFSEKSKICEHFYARQDGTRAYFFTEKYLMALFTGKQLFECQSMDYVERETLNHATKDKHSRIFLQAKFVCKKSEPL